MADGYTAVWGIQGADPSVHAQEQDEHGKRHQRSGARWVGQTDNCKSLRWDEVAHSLLKASHGIATQN